MKKILKWVFIAFVGVIVLGLIIDTTRSPEEKAADAERRAQEKAAALAEKAEALAAMPTISAVQLARDYEANTVSADQKYKNKEFKVSGKVTDINTDFMGNPYITLGGTNDFMQPQTVMFSHQEFYSFV